MPSSPIPHGLREFSTTVIVVLWVECAIALLVTSLRLYSRRIIRKFLGWDDYLISYACIIQIVFCSIVTSATHYGFGRHSDTLSHEQVVMTSKLLMIGEAFVISIFSIGKSAVAIFQLRIVIVRWQRFLLWFIIISLNLVFYIEIPLSFLQCAPTSHLWDPTIPAKCWLGPNTAYSIFIGGYGALCDLILALLPWRIVWNLHMRQRLKIGIALAMSSGVFASACGIAKAIHLIGLSMRSDQTYVIVSILLWSSSEITLTAVGACLPTFRPLIGKYASASVNEAPLYLLQSPDRKRRCLQNAEDLDLESKTGDDKLQQVQRAGNSVQAQHCEVESYEGSNRTLLGGDGKAVTSPEGAIRVVTEAMVSIESNHGNFVPIQDRF